jgi:hypothetical protein
MLSRDTKLLGIPIDGTCALELKFHQISKARYLILVGDGVHLRVEQKAPRLTVEYAESGLALQADFAGEVATHGRAFCLITSVVFAELLRAWWPVDASMLTPRLVFGLGVGERWSILARVQILKHQLDDGGFVLGKVDLVLNTLL